jgi:hypothetical protein
VRGSRIIDRLTGNNIIIAQIGPIGPMRLCQTGTCCEYRNNIQEYSMFDYIASTSGTHISTTSNLVVLVVLVVEHW